MGSRAVRCHGIARGVMSVINAMPLTARAAAAASRYTVARLARCNGITGDLRQALENPWVQDLDFAAAQPDGAGVLQRFQFALHHLPRRSHDCCDFTLR